MTRLLMLPSATRITNLTSYLTEANIKASYLLTNHQQSRRQTVLRTLLFVTMPKVQLNDLVLMLLYIICMNFEY